MELMLVFINCHKIQQNWPIDLAIGSPCEGCGGGGIHLGEEGVRSNSSSCFSFCSYSCFCSAQGSRLFQLVAPLPESSVTPRALLLHPALRLENCSQQKLQQRKLRKPLQPSPCCAGGPPSPGSVLRLGVRHFLLYIASYATIYSHPLNFLSALQFFSCATNFPYLIETPPLPSLTACMLPDPWPWAWSWLSRATGVSHSLGRHLGGGGGGGGGGLWREGREAPLEEGDASGHVC